MWSIGRYDLQQRSWNLLFHNSGFNIWNWNVFLCAFSNTIYILHFWKSLSQEALMATLFSRMFHATTHLLFLPHTSGFQCHMKQPQSITEPTPCFTVGRVLFFQHSLPSIEFDLLLHIAAAFWLMQAEPSVHATAKSFCRSLKGFWPPASSGIWWHWWLPLSATRWCTHCSYNSEICQLR